MNKEKRDKRIAEEKMNRERDMPEGYKDFLNYVKTWIRSREEQVSYFPKAKEVFDDVVQSIDDGLK